jgi:hypothetical protein
MSCNVAEDLPRKLDEVDMDHAERELLTCDKAVVCV